MGSNKGFVVFLGLLFAVAFLISSEVTARDLAEIRSSNQKNNVGQVQQTNGGVEESKYEGRGGWGRGGGPWEGGGGGPGWGGRGGGNWGGGGPGGWGGRGGNWGGGRGGGNWGRSGGGGCRWGCCGGGWRCRCCTYAEAFKN